MADVLDLDLDQERVVRREGKGDALRVRNRGQEFALPAELPLEALAPLADLDVDFGALMQQAMGAADANDRKEAGNILVDMLLTRKDLPKQVVDAVKTMLSVIFGPDQWAAFLNTRPSLPDFMALARGLFAAYGTSLGEALGSTSSSDAGGPTLSATSNANTGLTLAASGNVPATQAS
jgi:hypothetical protein